MKKLYQIILVCYVSVVVCILVGVSDGREDYRRVRRYLSFGNVSHFFVRINTKANMVHWNQIFAQTLGFRMNWDEPPDSFHPYHHLGRREVYNNLETLLDKNGVSGYHCVRRAVCEVRNMAHPQGVYHRILRMVFRRQSSSTDKWHNVTGDDCQLSISACPFSLLDVSLYTDL